MQGRGFYGPGRLEGERHVGGKVIAGRTNRYLLGLTGTQATDAGLDQVAGLAKATDLKLRRTEWTAERIEALEGPNLVSHRMGRRRDRAL
jgi:hypothetical protein